MWRNDVWRNCLKTFSIGWFSKHDEDISQSKIIIDGPITPVTRHRYVSVFRGSHLIRTSSRCCLGFFFISSGGRHGDYYVPKTSWTLWATMVSRYTRFPSTCTLLLKFLRPTRYNQNLALLEVHITFKPRYVEQRPLRMEYQIRIMSLGALVTGQKMEKDRVEQSVLGSVTYSASMNLLLLRQRLSCFVAVSAYSVSVNGGGKSKVHLSYPYQ